jgi:hypothetical protein
MAVEAGDLGPRRAVVTGCQREERPGHSGDLEELEVYYGPSYAGELYR